MFLWGAQLVASLVQLCVTTKNMHLSHYCFNNNNNRATP